MISTVELFISEFLIWANHSPLQSQSYSILLWVRLLAIIICFKSLLHFLQLYGPRLEPNPDVSRSAGISSSSLTVLMISTQLERCGRREWSSATVPAIECAQIDGLVTFRFLFYIVNCKIFGKSGYCW